MSDDTFGAPRFAGQVALVTGAARGQGRSHALALAREGASVVLVDICADVPTAAMHQATEADLNETVADVVELMQSRARELGVELAWEPAADLPEVLIDPDGIHRAVLNIVTNAIDAAEGVEKARVVEEVLA